MVFLRLLTETIRLGHALTGIAVRLSNSLLSLGALAAGDSSLLLGRCSLVLGPSGMMPRLNKVFLRLSLPTFGGLAAKPWHQHGKNDYRDHDDHDQHDDPG